MGVGVGVGGKWGGGEGGGGGAGLFLESFDCKLNCLQPNTANCVSPKILRNLILVFNYS